MVNKRRRWVNKQDCLLFIYTLVSFILYMGGVMAKQKRLTHLHVKLNFSVFGFNYSGGIEVDRAVVTFSVRC